MRFEPSPHYLRGSWFILSWSIVEPSRKRLEEARNRIWAASRVGLAKAELQAKGEKNDACCHCGPD